jgi:hypothetical protein
VGDGRTRVQFRLGRFEEFGVRFRRYGFHLRGLPVFLEAATATAATATAATAGTAGECRATRADSEAFQVPSSLEISSHAVVESV